MLSYITSGDLIIAICYFDDGWRHVVINSKLYTALPPPIRYLEKWKFVFSITLYCWEQQNCPKLHKNGNFHRYFVRCVLVLQIGGIPINYTLSTSLTIVLCF